MRKKNWQTGLNRFGAVIAAAGLPFTHLLGYIGLGTATVCGQWTNLLKDRKFTRIIFPMILFVGYIGIRAIFVDERAPGLATFGNFLANWLIPFAIGYANGFIIHKLLRIYIYSFAILIVIGLLSAAGILPHIIFGEKVWSEGMLWCFHHHNALASMLIIALGLSFFIGNYRKLIFWLFPLFLLAFFLTGSRGYLIAFPVLLFGLFYETLKSRKKIEGIVLAISLIIFILAALAVPTIRYRIQTITAGEWKTEIPALSRFGFWEIGKLAFAESPIFGIGPGQLQVRKDLLQKAEKYGLPIDEKSGKVRHLHNFYITILAEDGVIGIFLLLWTLYILGKSLYLKKGVSAKFIWAYFAILIGNMFDSQLRGPSGAVDLFFIMGLLISNGESNKPQ